MWSHMYEYPIARSARVVFHVRDRREAPRGETALQAPRRGRPGGIGAALLAGCLAAACGTPIGPVVTPQQPSIQPSRAEIAGREPGKEDDASKVAEPEDPASMCNNTSASDPAVRFESWSKHFRIYELLATGEKIPLGSDAVQYVDTASTVVIERISDTPQVIETTNGTIDARQDWDPVGFDVDVVVIGGDGCRRRAAIPGLQDVGGYDRGHRDPGCHHIAYPVFTRPFGIEKAARFLIAPWTFATGDIVQIQLEGRKIGEEDMPVKPTAESNLKVTGSPARGAKPTRALNARLDRSTREGLDAALHAALTGANGPLEAMIDLKGAESPTTGDLSVTIKRTICAKPFTASFRAINYASLVPVEDRRERQVPLVQLNGRSDNRNDVYFAFEGVAPEINDQLFREAIVMTATAIDADQNSRSVGLAKDSGRPTLAHLNGGETVVVKLARKIQGDGGKPSEVPLKSYTFSSVAAGIHADIAGDRKASYGTSSSLFVLFKHRDQNYGFAQTFSYTITNKTLTPSFWDELGLGVHVSVLARNKESDVASDKPVALGVGGHIALGANAFHLGAGYDVINSGAYLVLGISVADFANFLQAQTSITP